MVGRVYFPDITFDNFADTEHSVRIIRNLTKGTTYFFGLYRQDGKLLISEVAKLRSEIPRHFRERGCFFDLTPDKIKQDTSDTRISAVGCLEVNEDTFAYLPYICNYFLETAFFCPLRPWNEFIKEYPPCDMGDPCVLLTNHYANMVFTYVDGGDFYVYFNKNIYNSHIIDSILE